MRVPYGPLLFLAGFSASCGESVAHQAADKTHDPPTNHRSSAVICPVERAPGNADIVMDCTEDSECAEGTNGRCISPNVVGPSGGSRCSYDACFSDSDCPAGEPCRCRESAASNAPNYCVADSNCRVDADCGRGGFCSPSLLDIDSSVDGSPTSGAGFVRFGYFCHTTLDRCVNDGDCDPSTCELPSCALLACGYTTEERWDCFRVGTH